jgi:exodeoxyribonuclease VII small subunit
METLGRQPLERQAASAGLYLIQSVPLEEAMSSNDPQTTPIDELDFESAYRLLAETVDRLEAGDLTLDQAIKLYEQGTRLTQRCTQLLDAAEIQIETLGQELQD